MNSFKLLQSKTFWGAVIMGVVHVLGVAGVIPSGVVTAVGEAVGGVMSVAGARQAIAKNGAGK